MTRMTGKVVSKDLVRNAKSGPNGPVFVPGNIRGIQIDGIDDEDDTVLGDRLWA